MPLRFDEFTLDLDARQLTRPAGAVHLSPKAFDLLALLVARRPGVVTKAELLDHLWPGTFVVEANLSNLVGELRAGLDDRGRTPKYLRTAHRRGYAFCGDVKEDFPAPESKVGRVSCWIEWGQQRFPLPPGEHVIGRDPDAGVRLDSTTVSRRHARLLVSAAQTVLEDFGSKNGTFIGEERVVAPRTLADGDAIRIGDLLVTYRAPGAGSSTKTVAFAG
ncbi:MAG TPA: FHA domain-containing protein [Vicinamibacterales bacterium]|nr:FHA domain-containing protein [Vicinamibacterales bacterium]HET9703934.1 FHA domain-containing protein [Vicinamibacterales bacterium]